MFLTAEPLVKEPTQEEMEKAIGNLKTNKAPGEDIIAELIKNSSWELKKRLYALICKIWRDEKMPDDWKIVLIIPLFKKGDKMKCENYRGITLLNVAYKMLSTGTVERVLRRDFGRVPVWFQTTKRNSGSNICSKADT